jgi:hypothetical protein
MGEGSDNQTVCTQWGQPELCGGSACPQWVQPGRGSLLRALRKASARIQGLERGGSRFSD